MESSEMSNSSYSTTGNSSLKRNFDGEVCRAALDIGENSKKQKTGEESEEEDEVQGPSEEDPPDVHKFLARWLNEAKIPSAAVNCDSFVSFVEAVGQYGHGYQPPSPDDLREAMSNEELEKYKEEWARNGCSILINAWSNPKKRSNLRLSVNCSKRTTFFEPEEVPEDAHIESFICDYVDQFIEKIGQEIVVQVVTDDGSNFMAAANLLKLKRPNIFWTSCADHLLNLMFEDISNLPIFKVVIDKVKAFTTFIYAHRSTLAMMRTATATRDLVRRGFNKCATCCLSLRSLVNNRLKLRAMVVSEAWEQCKHSKTLKGEAAYDTMLCASFWSGVSLCLEVFRPLLKMLCLNLDKQYMGFLYGELLQAKEEIKMAFDGQEVTYRPILDIMDRNASGKLDGPLHLAAYALNPYFFYKNRSITFDCRVMDGIMDCVKKLFSDDCHVQDVTRELMTYKNKAGMFETVSADMGCGSTFDLKYDPVEWWSIHGRDIPRLQKVAMRILSLTTSTPVKINKKTGEELDPHFVAVADMAEEWFGDYKDEDVEHD